MTSINNVNSKNLLAGYLDSTSQKDLDEKTIFKKLSVDVGSDGKTISKDQLDKYIAKAEEAKEAYADKETEEDTSGITDKELAGLKDIQKNWKTLSDGSDSITYADMAQNKGMLTALDTPDKKKAVDIDELKKNSMNVNEYLKEQALKFSVDLNKPSGQKSLLHTLLTGSTDENDDSNSEMIAKLTNMLEEARNKSTVEEEA